MYGMDDETGEAVAGALRAAAEAGRSQTAPVDVTAALTEGRRRRHARRRRGQVFGSTLVVVLSAAILVPALALRSPHGSTPRSALPGTTAGPLVGGGTNRAAPAVACKGSWLHVSMSLVPPLPKEGATPPLTLHEVVTVRTSHRCTLLRGWLKLRSVRQSGTPSAAVRESHVGKASSVIIQPVSASDQVGAMEVTPATVAVATVTLRIPWYLPYGNLCAAWVTLGISPPNVLRAFRADIPSGCGTGSLGTMRATVHPLRAVPLGLAG